MLKGLEISEIQYSQITYNNRYDSEYFQRKFIEGDIYLRKRPFFQIGDQFKVTDGEHGSVVFQDGGIKYLTAENVKKGYVDISNIRYVSEEVNRRNARASVKAGDVLISIKGTLGEVAVAEEWLLPANMNRDVAIFKPLSQESPHSEYLALFLMSYYGSLQSLRGGSGGVQQMLTLQRLRKFVIPSFNTGFYEKVSEIYHYCQITKINSQSLYSQAEALLLESVGLTDFKPSQDAVNIKTFKESFGATSRLDAEYYQKKYDEIEGKFDNFERIRLGDLVTYPICSGTTPKAGGDDYTDATNGVPFVRAVDLQNGEVSVDNFNYIKPAIHNGILKRTKLKKNDVLFSIAGTVGRTAIFKHDFEANINQAVAILRFKEDKIRRIYLIVLFNSDIGKEFVSKYSRQGVQTNLNLSELADLSIPIIDLSIQEEITALVEESFTLKAESERLLEVAKRAVEIAIEQDEATALEFIEQEGAG